jgi:transcriptional regulator with XRE-family HTH domain
VKPNPSTYTQFGKEVYSILQAKSWTITKLAKELNLSKQYVADILKGNRNSEQQKRRILEKLEGVI